MFKCSVQEGWQNRKWLALGICFGQPRRAHQILFDVRGEVHPSAPMVTPNAWPRQVVTSPQLPSPRTLFIVVYILV